MSLFLANRKIRRPVLLLPQRFQNIATIPDLESADDTPSAGHQKGDDQVMFLDVSSIQTSSKASKQGNYGNF